MKTRKILAIAIIAIMFLAVCVTTVHAWASLEEIIIITSGTYTTNQEITELPTAETMEAGKTLQLNAYVDFKMTAGSPTPGEETGQVESHKIKGPATNVTWTSTDTTVATISSTGLVTGKKAGTTTIKATSPDTNPADVPGSITLTVTGSTEPTVEFTDFSNVTFNIEDPKTFDNVTVTFKNFTPKEGHRYSVFATQDASYTHDETKSAPMSALFINYDEEKKVYFARLDNTSSSLIAEQTKDAYLVVIERDNDSSKTKMVLKPTKVAKPTIKANLGGGYLESFHVNDDNSSFFNTVRISQDRQVTYKLGEVTDISILDAISKEQSGSFEKLLAYAKADSKPLTTGSFQYVSGSYETANIAKATGKIAADKYYYVYEVADTVNGKYVPVEDVIIFNGSDHGILTHFAFAGSQSSDPYTGNTNTTNPTNVTGDNSIATKKIPQTGATPVFMIVLGSGVLVAGVFVVANKKYRDIK